MPRADFKGCQYSQLLAIPVRLLDSLGSTAFPFYGHSGVKPTALAVGYKPANCVNYVKIDLTFRLIVA